MTILHFETPTWQPQEAHPDQAAADWQTLTEFMSLLPDDCLKRVVNAYPTRWCKGSTNNEYGQRCLLGHALPTRRLGDGTLIFYSPFECDTDPWEMEAYIPEAFDRRAEAEGIFAVSTRCREAAARILAGRRAAEAVEVY